MTGKNPTPIKARIASITEGAAFPVSMAVCMVYGMELYNHVLMGVPLVPSTFLSPISELLPMAVAVLLVEKFIGSRIVGAVLDRMGGAEGHVLPAGVVMGAVTCAAMCPFMSMVATLVFKHPTFETVAPLWLGTFVRNLPFALVWAILVARPISGAVTARVVGGA